MMTPKTLTRTDEVPPVLWKPSTERNQQSNFTRYLDWLRRERGLSFEGYHDVQKWSATNVEAFWLSMWDFLEVKAGHPYDTVLSSRRMPDARWFPGARLNYAEHAFRHETDRFPALLVASEQHPLKAVSWTELRRQVAGVAASLRGLGISQGDRVVGYLPNIPEAIVAMLACASLGAIWSSCSPECGAQAVIERFKQLEPRLLITVDGYHYGGRPVDRTKALAALRRELSSVRHTVLVPRLDTEPRLGGMMEWEALLSGGGALTFDQVPFDHPLWVLFSSGTTGLPKAIVHGHGGIVLEHLKSLVLHNDLKPGDRLFWFTTTTWMMWNVLASGLMAGCTIVLYDGSPGYPDLDVLWRLAQDARVTRLGGGAAYFVSRMRVGSRPGDGFDLSALRSIGSTGAPLPPEGFRWIYSAVKRDVWLTSASGGTDVCTGLVGACPGLPVREGEIQGRALGVAAEAFDETGRPVVGEPGELVITQPLPSMPVAFWNDPDGRRYRETYFDRFPGVWRHGDRILFTERGSAVVSGRSDATLNRLGVRIGAGEVYRAVAQIPEVVDSLVVGVELPHAQYYMPLFVTLAPGVTLDDKLRASIARRIRDQFSRWHVPDEIIQAPAIPRTVTGKTVEVPIKRILSGDPVDEVVSVASLRPPEAIEFFVDFAAEFRARLGKAEGTRAS